MAEDKHVDEVTGVETTGHVWDGDLRELNKPLPTWWLYVLYATIIWSIGYWIVYPAWPTLTGYTAGIWNYSQRQVVADEIASAKESQKTFRDRIGNSALEDILKDKDLLSFARAGGAASFGDNCAACHGRGAQGSKGYPNLNDDDWIWGGSLDAIHTSIKYGIRSGDDNARDMAMPRFGLDEILEDPAITDVAHYVRSLSGADGVDTAAAGRGETAYKEQCAACHGDTGAGNQEMGAPSLSDRIWLYGGDQVSVEKSIETGRGGRMPGWHTRLDPETIKMLTVYVHTLGGGQ